MSDPVSRYELNSNLAARDARLDAALEKISDAAADMRRTCDGIRADGRAMEARLEVRFASIDAKFASIDAKFTSIDTKFDRIEAKFDRIDAKFDSFDEKFSSMKKTIIVMGIGTALTVVFGVGTFNATLTSNMLAAFQMAASSQQHARMSLAQPQFMRPPQAFPLPAPPPGTAEIVPPEAPR